MQAESHQGAELPLAGIRIVDFTHHAAGPMCTMLLGDYGAEVIKIEPPGGEAFRTSGTVKVKGEHVGFLALNRNKQSVVLDLKTAAGRDAALKLIAGAHAVVENFRPGTMDRLGLSYERLLEANPKVIYCSISAFGAHGPQKDKQGLDVVLQAMSGLMSITGEPGGGPLPAGAPIADIFSGVTAALGVVLAIVGNRNTGKPQRVEVSMLDAMLSLMGLRIQQVLASGETLPRLGAAHPQASPWDVFQAADAPFVIAATRDEYWQRLCGALGIDQFAHDPRYATITQRVAHREQVNRLLNDIFRTRPRAHWLAAMDAAQVPNGPVNTLAEVMSSEPISTNGAMLDVSHPAGGEFRMAGPPIRINGQRGASAGPPATGQHTARWLAGAG